MQLKELSQMLDVKDTIPLGLGSIAALNPIWFDYFSAVYQLVLGLGGATIVGLTIYNKVLDVRIKRNTIEEFEHEDN